MARQVYAGAWYQCVILIILLKIQGWSKQAAGNVYGRI